MKGYVIYRHYRVALDDGPPTPSFCRLPLPRADMRVERAQMSTARVDDRAEFTPTANTFPATFVPSLQTSASRTGR